MMRSSPKLLAALLLVSGLFSLGLLPASETPKPPPSDQEKLLRGEVLVTYKMVEDSKISMVQGQIMYEATPEQVWAVLVDYPAYPRMFPDMNSITVMDGSGGAVRIRVKTQNYWPYPDLNYILRMQPSAASLSIDWKMEEGNLKTLYGACKLFPFPGQKGRTLAVYSLVQDPGWLVPRFSSEMGNRSLVIERLLGLRQEVRNRKKTAPAPEIRPQWRKALFWWERQPESDPTLEELFNPPFAAPPPPAKP